MRKPYHVYILVDPRASEVFYVGITDDLHTRFTAHCLMSQGKNPQKSERIQQIRAAQLEPIIQVVETVQSKLAARIREKYWIAWYTQQGHPLTNILCLPRVPAQARKPARARRVYQTDVWRANTYTAAQAIARLGISYDDLSGLVRTGVIARDILPGFSHARYARLQIDRLAAQVASS